MAYPTSLDNFTPKVDNTDDVVALDVNELQTAIEALEAKVGIDSSAVTSSLDYKINNLKTDSIAEKTLNAGVTIDGLLLKDRTISLLDYADLDTVTTDPAHLEGRYFYDKDKKCLAFYNDQSTVKHQVGRELWARSCNKTGVDIANGKIVYINGVDTGCPTIELAQPDQYTKSRIIGMTTQIILDTEQGEVTNFGLINDLDTSLLDLGDVYLEHDGTLTNTVPSGAHFRVLIGKVLVKHASEGVIFVNPIISDLTVEVTDTNGFADRDTTDMSFVDGTRTFTLAPTDTHFHYYINGNQQYVFGSVDAIITDVEGIHAIYFDDETHVLSSIANPNEEQIDQIIRTKCLVAYIYWDATNSDSSYFADERHGISMSPQTHAYLHFTRGAQFLSGLGLGHLSVDDAAVDAASAQFSAESGLTIDEDLLTVYSTIISTTGLPIYYLDGVNGYLRRTTQAGFSIKAGVVDGNPLWNEFTGGAWTTTELGNNNYCLYHIFAINGYAGQDQQISIMGQNEYITVALARAGASTEISSIISAFPFEEIVPIGTVIVQANTAYANDVNARLRSDGDGNNYVDWRSTELAQGVNPSAHGNLTGLLNDDHSQYLLLLGRPGGQTIRGGNAASEDVNIESTAHATKGKINLKDDTQLGRSGVKSGVLAMFGKTSGAATITVPDVVTSYTLTLPPELGAAGSVPTDVAGDGVWTMVVPESGGGGISEYDALVAPAGGDYTTVSAAVAAGKYNLLGSGIIVETGDVALVADTCISLFLMPDSKYQMDAYNFNNALNSILALRGGCVRTSEVEFSLGTLSGATKTYLDNLYIDMNGGSTVTGGFVVADNLYIEVGADQIFANTSKGSNITNIHFNCSNTSGIITTSYETNIDGILVEGTIDFNDPLIEIKGFAGGHTMSNVKILASASGAGGGIEINKPCELNNIYMPLHHIDVRSAANGSQFNNVTAKAIDLTDAASVGNLYSNVTITEAAVIGGDSHEFSTCKFLAGATINAGGDDNGFSVCQFGVDGGGGAATLNIALGALRTRVVGCKTDAPLNDNEATTAIAANTEY